MFAINQNLIDNFADKINEKEKKNNKVSSWSDAPTDINYPSEKLVKDGLDGKQEKLVNGANLKTLNGVGLLGKGDITIDVGGGDDSIIYQPTLDGTESITTIKTYTPTITGNTLTNGCGYLTNGWDNTIDWELTFDYYTTGDNNGYLVVPKGTTQRDYKGVQQWFCNQLNFYVNGTKPTGYITNATSCNEWISVKITKIGYIWTVYYNGVLKTQWDTESYANIVDSWTEMCIGLDKNSSRNYSTIKNIKVKAISGVSENIIYLGDEFWKKIYPVGSIYISVNSTSPQTLFGGTWEQIKDTFLLACGDTYSNGDTGGEATHTLTTDEMPSHTHTQNPHSHTIGSLTRYNITGKGVAAVGDGYGNTQNYKTGNTTATNKNTGGGQAHNNMPPYLTVFMWKRTA